MAFRLLGLGESFTNSGAGIFAACVVYVWFGMKKPIASALAMVLLTATCAASGPCGIVEAKAIGNDTSIRFERLATFHYSDAENNDVVIGSGQVEKITNDAQLIDLGGALVLKQNEKISLETHHLICTLAAEPHNDRPTLKVKSTFFPPGKGAAAAIYSESSLLLPYLNESAE